MKNNNQEKRIPTFMLTVKYDAILGAKLLLIPQAPCETNFLWKKKAKKKKR